MQACEKAAIRKAVRSAFSQEKREMESRLICRHVLACAEYGRARVIGGYMPMKHEADITPILLDALSRGKTLALPRCQTPPEMTFHRISSLDELQPGAYGLLEPAADAPVIAPEEIGLLLAPLEALTRQGMRLGKGGGYYDCLLAKKDISTMGAVLSWQWVEALPASPWDRPLVSAADAQGIHRF